MTRSIRWLGHAGFVVTSAGGKVIYFDPYIEDNPVCPICLDDVGKADIVLVTHDHFDHTGSAADIVKKTGATLVAMPETAATMVSQMGVPSDSVVNYGSGMNIGGTSVVGDISIVMTQAFHSSATAAPAGYIVVLEDGYTIYHAGDTGIFAGMQILAELYPVDLALLPIGSTFTMDPLQAARALSLIRPKKAIPMHFGTWPLLEPGADRFVELARKEAPAVEVIVLEPGQEVAL